MTERDALVEAVAEAIWIATDGFISAEDVPYQNLESLRLGFLADKARQQARAAIAAVREHDPGAAELREALTDMTYQFAYETTTRDDVPALWTGGLSALEGAFAALGWEEPHPVPERGCEHPGCGRVATFGTPTPDGYQRLCGEHFRELDRARAEAADA